MKPTETPRETSTVGKGEWFATTHWSVVLAAKAEDSAQAMKALEKLCRGYWYPLYAYVRRRGYSEHDAQDLTQGFFAHLLRKEGFRAAMPGRGKFRSFLLVSLNHFLADEHDRQQAQKRGGGQTVLSFDTEEAEQRYQLEPRHQETPEKLFERQWAVAVLNNALLRLEQEFVVAGKQGLLTELRPFVIEDSASRTYAQAATSLGMSEAAVKKAAQRMRQRFQEVLREEIGHTVADSSEIDEELRHLWNALAT